MPVGIISYGVYIPRFRISVKEIASVWNEDGDVVSRGINVKEKSVPALDEDTITMSAEASMNAVRQAANFDPVNIEAVYVGSESHPYAVKPSAVTIAELIGAVPECTCADLEFACKAGTAGMQMIMGMVSSGQIRYGLAVGSDTAQGRPGDALEYTASSGAISFIIGAETPIATIEGTFSYSTDTPDFFRREGQTFPVHASRFTGKPSYFKHVISATQGLMERLDLSVEDIDWVSFHTPNGKFPIVASKMLGFPFSKVEKCVSVVNRIGNTYSGAAMLGLANILDSAEPGQRCLMTSYGSGAGADAFSFVVTDEILETRGKVPTVEDYINYRIPINYSRYAKNRGKILLH